MKADSVNARPARIIRSSPRENSSLPPPASRLCGGRLAERMSAKSGPKKGRGRTHKAVCRAARDFNMAIARRRLRLGVSQPAVLFLARGLLGPFDARKDRADDFVRLPGQSPGRKANTRTHVITRTLRARRGYCAGATYYFGPAADSAFGILRRNESSLRLLT